MGLVQYLYLVNGHNCGCIKPWKRVFLKSLESDEETSEWLGRYGLVPKEPGIPARSWLVGTPRSSGCHHARPLDVRKKDSIYITMVYQTC